MENILLEKKLFLIYLPSENNPISAPATSNILIGPDANPLWALPLGK